jgi:GNAT superfamily N-acetyltransferase
MSLKYNLGVSGDINTPQGLEVYVYNEEKICSLNLTNYEFIDIIQSDFAELLNEDILFNYKNCLITTNVVTKEKYRRMGYGKLLIDETFKIYKKMKIDYFLAYRFLENNDSKFFWDKFDVTYYKKNKKLQIFYKKI